MVQRFNGAGQQKKSRRAEQIIEKIPREWTRFREILLSQDYLSVNELRSFLVRAKRLGILTYKEVRIRNNMIGYWKRND